jgi:hypothetical protein
MHPLITNLGEDFVAFANEERQLITDPGSFKLVGISSLCKFNFALVIVNTFLLFYLHWPAYQTFCSFYLQWLAY